MTQEELRFYSTLPPCWKEEFNNNKLRHPEWELIQHMNRISIGITLEGEDCKGGLIGTHGDPPIGKNPIFLKKLFEKTESWMGRNLPPDLYTMAKPAFKSAIMVLDDFIAKGIKIVENLWNMICSFFK